MKEKKRKRKEIKKSQKKQKQKKKYKELKKSYFLVAEVSKNMLYLSEHSSPGSPSEMLETRDKGFFLLFFFFLFLIFFLL